MKQLLVTLLIAAGVVLTIAGVVLKTWHYAFAGLGCFAAALAFSKRRNIPPRTPSP